MDFEKEIKKSLKKETGNDNLEIPPSPDLGDYAFPCFILASKYKKTPSEIATELANKLEIKGVEINATGPYLNFFVDKSTIAKDVLVKAFKQEDYGSETKKEKTIVIDYSAPNVAKHMGIHNLRSTVIGQALSSTYKYLGYKVQGVNHLGDWGTNFGQLITGIKKYSSLSKIKNVQDLNKIYVKFHHEMEKHPELEQKARDEFSKLETGNIEAKKYWKKFVAVSLKDYDKLYTRLGIKFESTKGESEYIPLIGNTLKILKKHRLTKESDGALVVEMGKDMPPCLLKKSDGSTLYGLRDVTAGLFRLKHYKPKKVLYVVDIAQSLHFQQCFKVLEKINKKNKEIFEHIIFGRLSFKDGTMSTRKGKVVILEDVLNKAVEKVLNIIKEKNPKLKNKKDVAEKVGVGAVVFNDLFNDRIHNIIFDWNKVLDFEGSTGPYIQYAYARCSAILKKYNKKVDEKVEFELLNEDSEFALLKLLQEFPEVLNNVIKDNKPSHLAKYSIKLAQTFNNFYGICHVVTEDEELTKVRILLVYCVRKVLKKGLTLLGIEAPLEM